MKKDLAIKVLTDKLNGLSDKEIGEKYNINLKYIEKIITKYKGINISNLNIRKKIKGLYPKKFELENYTVWSFKSRGDWATHNGNYRGNWSPYIPRNVILRYSKEKDLVLDYFCGSGTTAIECKLLNRNFIGLDINEKAIELAKENLNFEYLFPSNIQLKVGDARDLSFIENNSIDLICAHPPYANIIKYTFNNKSDLSHLDVEDFLVELERVAKESYRVLKNEKYCAILIGDIRKNKNVIPLGFWTIQQYLKAGFKIKELVIKRQHNCKTTGFWYKNSIKCNFLLLAHEYLAIFKKTDNSIDDNSIAMLEKKKLVIPEFDINKDINLETKTVWIFNKENLISDAILNLIKRYSYNYCIYNEKFDKNSELIIYFYDNDFDFFLKEVENIKKDTIIAIFSEDKRLENGLLFSEPLLIENKLSRHLSLKIKEIIILTTENNKEKVAGIDLNISHKYILIYKKI